MKNNLITFLLALAITPSAFALEVDGTGDRTNVTALYLFNEGSGTVVHDSITTGGQLNLTLYGAANSDYSWIPGGGIQFSGNAIARSPVAATKIINACSASNEVTIETWIVDNTSQIPTDLIGARRIVSLSSGTQKPEGFYFGTDYRMGFTWGLFAGTTDTLDPDTHVLQKPDGVLTPVTNFRPSDLGLKHIYLIKDKGGNASIYVSDVNGNPILTSPMGANLNASFANMSATYRLGIGNDNNFDGALGATGSQLKKIDATVYTTLTTETIESKAFNGTVKMVAIYCKALTPQQILGGLYASDWIAAEAKLAPVVDPLAPISPERQLSQLLYRRLGGVALPIDAQTLVDMETALKNNGGVSSEAARMAAADIAAHKAGFYNRTVRDFAKPMSNRAEVVNVDLNDFVATIIGITRDDIDARQTLMGNFWYMADPTKASVSSDLVSILSSNTHYKALQDNNYDLSSVLMKVPTQYYLSPVSTDSFIGAKVVDATNWDYGGVLTSRAFLSEHAIAGTNRRLVEFTFREFMCRQMTQWADASAPDQYVGMDVDRFPTANHAQYQTVCRSCHGQMDGLRPAFSRITFETGFAKHYGIISATPDMNPNNSNANTAFNTMNLGYPLDLVNATKTGFGNSTVAGKYSRNFTMFPTGYLVQDSSWKNFAVNGNNGQYFGWNAFPVSGTGSTTTASATNNPPIAGNGVAEFAAMIAQSRGFPYCMTQRAFSTICKRDPASTGPTAASDSAVLDRVFKSFTDSTKDNFNFRRLFERMAVQPECLGQ